MKTKTAKASELAEVCAIVYAKAETENERKLLAELAAEIGKQVTNDYQLFAAEVLTRTAKKLLEKDQS